MKATTRPYYPYQSNENVSSKTVVNYYDLTRIRALIDSNFKLFDQAGADNDTGLHHACRFGKRKVAQLLVEKKPGMIRMRNKFEKTPLHSMGHKADNCKTAIHLISKNPGVLLDKDREGRTPIHSMFLQGAYRSTCASLKHLMMPYDNKKIISDHIKSLLPVDVYRMVWDYYCPDPQLLREYVNSPDKYGKTLSKRASRKKKLPEDLRKAIKSINEIIETSQIRTNTKTLKRKRK